MRFLFGFVMVLWSGITNDYNIPARKEMNGRVWEDSPDASKPVTCCSSRAHSLQRQYLGLLGLVGVTGKDYMGIYWEYIGIVRDHTGIMGIL